MRGCFTRHVTLYTVLCAAVSSFAANVDIGPVTLWLGDSTSTGAVHGTGTAARFNTVGQVAVHPTTHDLYVLETANHVVRRVPSGSSATENWLSSLGAGSGAGTVDGTGARLNGPTDCVITPDGATMYVSETGNHIVRIVTIATADNRVFVGQMGTLGYDEGTGTTAKLGEPNGIVLAGTNLYVAESNPNRIRKITNAAVTSTHAGDPYDYGSLDGTASSATFLSPIDIEYHPNGGAFYVSDRGNFILRKVLLSDGRISTVAVPTRYRRPQP